MEPISGAETSSGKRVDARRNRERILTAARAALADPGVDVSMAEISRRAGVGMATLYRNFSTRQELLEALYATEADTAFTPQQFPPGTPSGEQLRAWLRQFFTFAASKRHIAAALLTHVQPDSPIFDTTRTRVIAAGRPLLEAAQATNEIRDDLTVEQVLQMLVSIATIDGDTQYQEPMLRTVLDGLAPPRPTTAYSFRAIRAAETTSGTGKTTRPGAATPARSASGTTPELAGAASPDPAPQPDASDGPELRA